MINSARKPPTQPPPPPMAIQRWENEGGAPKDGDRSRKKRGRDTSQSAKGIVGIATDDDDNCALK